MSDRSRISIGRLSLKNPIVAAAGEQVMTEAGIRAALDAGCGAVIAKSFSESEAARDQLDRTDYVLLDSQHRPVPWDFNPPEDVRLACRSGLIRTPWPEWIESIAKLDRDAASNDQIVAASIILAELEPAVEMAKAVEAAGIRLLEFNIGTPYGDEAGGAVSTERASSRVEELVRAVTSAVSMPVWVKLTGQSESVPALAKAAMDADAEAVIMIGRFLAMVPDVDTMKPMLDTNLGYGGGWALPLACYWLSQTRKALGPDAQLVGTNGVKSGLDVARILLAGGRAAELSTAVMAGGFGVLAEAVAEFEAWLERHDTTAEAVIGHAADAVKSFPELPMRPGTWEKFVPPETLA